MLEDRAAIKVKPESLEEWANRNLTQFSSAGQTQRPKLGKKSPCNDSLVMSFLGSSSAEKSLGSVAESKLQVSQQCVLEVKMVNSTLGCMNSCTARRLQEGIIPLISPHLDNVSSFGDLTQYKKDIHKLEWVHGRATKMVWNWST